MLATASMPRRDHDAAARRRSSRRRTSRPRSRCSARCCSPRARSGRSPRSSTPPTSTARATGRSTAPRSRSTAKGEPVDAITLVDELEERGELEQVGGRGRIHELAALVPATANAAHYARIVARDGDAARARPRRRRRSRGSARSGPARRPTSSTGPSRSSSTSRSSGSRATSPHRGAAEGELRADHAAVRGRRRRHRRPDRLPGARPAHVGLPAGQPDHPRGAPVDGEVGARALHGGEPRRAPRRPGRAVHARDVEDRGDAADDVQRGEGRVAAPAHRQARRRTTGRA